MTLPTSKKSLRILAVAHEGIGHVNAVLGLAEPLQARGHQIVFVSTESVRHLVKHKRFYACEYLKENGKSLPREFTTKPNPSNLPQARNFGGNSLRSRGILSGIDPLEKVYCMLENPFPLRLLHSVYLYEDSLEAIVRKHSPIDLILLDHFIPSPALVYHGCPWVYVHSACVLYGVESPQTPPPFSGYPTNEKREPQWSEFKQLIRQWHGEAKRQMQLWYKMKKVPALEDAPNRLAIIESPYLNVYQYPRELDYEAIRPLKDKWISVDTFGLGRAEEESSKFRLPEEFLNSNSDSKLIYFSLGTLGCFDTDLMKRLIAIFAKTKHRFVVSKGALGAQVTLPANMYGANYVPQVEILKLVDLVITHGGNNTFTETFAAGRPMLVMPLFADQYDNARRVEECAYGRQLNPYNASEGEITDAIEQLLGDDELHKRLAGASRRIRETNCIEVACDRIETLVA